VHKISKHLHPFYVKCGICQLTDHVYNMSMHIFCNYSVTMLLNKTVKMHRKTWYADTCSINGHVLTI
jgi:hypothetical protein